MNARTELLGCLRTGTILSKEYADLILDIYKSECRQELYQEQLTKINNSFKFETAHGHSGNDDIPQPDPNAGPFSPMTRIESNGTGEVTDHPNII